MPEQIKSRKKMTEESLNLAFSPERLEIVNESHLHAGHHHGDGRPFDGSGETHFRVRIVSSAFAGKSRLERHRAVNAALDGVLKDGLHALAIDASAPGEVTRW
jgi:BolA family transcriptional regulator, general stress-responsive regulator